MARSLEVSHRPALGASSLPAPLDEARPGEHEAQLPPAEVAVDDFEVVDADLRFSFGMAGVEMREAVIVKEHRDRDPEEATDCRHRPIMARAAAARPSLDFGSDFVP